MKAKSKYTVQKWEERTAQQVSAETKTTKASVEYAFTGDLEGNGIVEYLMFYKKFDEKDPHKATADYVGLIVFQGRVGGKTGSFVLEDVGVFENGTASSRLRILSGSGTGELKQIQGTGNYRANQDGFFLELEYQL